MERFEQNRISERGAYGPLGAGLDAGPGLEDTLRGVPAGFDVGGKQQETQRGAR